MINEVTDELVEESALLGNRIRGRCVEMSHRARTPHLGSALSVADILSCLYSGAANVTPANVQLPDRDRVILSKGHAATALYAVLAEKGIIAEALIDEFASEGAALAEQPAPNCAHGVELATGSLGHGLPVAVGLALGNRLANINAYTWVVLSDGECNEGTVWEAAMLAASLRLRKLCVVVDYNKWQATGRSNETLALSPLCDKWSSFGWHAVEVDGHDCQSLHEALLEAYANQEGPSAIIANTVKGKGVSFMEDDNNWHYRIPKVDEVEQAKTELGLGGDL